MMNQNEAIRKEQETEAFLRKHGIQPGLKFDDNGTPSVFSRIGYTGMMICHPEGEPDMQSSWAMRPEAFAKRYLNES